MTERQIPPIRSKKKTKSSPKVVSAEVKDRILGRVAREEKAYRIVERLIDNPVSSELLFKSLAYINQSVYNDIVEERSIVKNCGYPICGKSLPMVIKKQTYGINPRINKVYKLEERVKFCSLLCFNCSRELRDQLSVEPVWLIPQSAHKGVQVIPVNTEEDVDKNEELPKNFKIDEKHLKEIVHIVKPTVIKETCMSDKKPPDGSTHTKVQPITDISSTLDAQFSWLNMKESDDSSGDERESRTNASIPNLSFLESIKHCLMQWKSPQSSAYLMDTVLSNPAVDDDLDDIDDDDYLLDEDLKINAPENRGPIPDSSTLVDKNVRISEVDQPAKDIVLPKIDSVNQIQQRQNIVILKLQVVIAKILANTKFQYRDISSVVFKLVSLLNISSSNCMFSEKQWHVIGGVLLLQTYHILPVLKSYYTYDEFHEIVWKCIEKLLSDKSELDQLIIVFR